MDLNESEVNVYYNDRLTSVFAYPLWKMRHIHVHVNINFPGAEHNASISSGLCDFTSDSHEKPACVQCIVRPGPPERPVQVEEFALQLGGNGCVCACVCVCV